MSQTVMNTKCLPDILFGLIQTEQVIVYEADGEVRLVPVAKTGEGIIGCPLRGMFVGNNSAVDTFIAKKQAEKKLER